jgi:signal transduction histidine kinase
VTVQAGVQDGQALLCVADNGPGMPAADRARVGERFLRVADPAAPQEARGSGLGLAIAHAIAQRHGGRLQLEEARPGQAAPGLRVGVEWPV